MIKMKTFIVARDEYSRGGPSALTVELHKAENITKLLIELMSLKDWAEDEGYDLTNSEKIMEDFESGNGDGQDFLVIYELVKDKLRIICGGY